MALRLQPCSSCPHTLGLCTGHPQLFMRCMFEMIRLADMYGCTRYRAAFLHFACTLEWLKEHQKETHRLLMENLCCLVGVFIEVCGGGRGAWCGHGRCGNDASRPPLSSLPPSLPRFARDCAVVPLPPLRLAQRHAIPFLCVAEHCTLPPSALPPARAPLPSFRQYVHAVLEHGIPSAKTTHVSVELINKLLMTWIEREQAVTFASGECFGGIGGKQNVGTYVDSDACPDANSKVVDAAKLAITQTLVKLLRFKPRVPDQLWGHGGYLKFDATIKLGPQTASLGVELVTGVEQGTFRATVQAVVPHGQRGAGNDKAGKDTADGIRKRGVVQGDVLLAATWDGKRTEMNAAEAVSQLKQTRGVVVLHFLSGTAGARVQGASVVSPVYGRYPSSYLLNTYSDEQIDRMLQACERWSGRGRPARLLPRGMTTSLCDLTPPPPCAGRHAHRVPCRDEAELAPRAVHVVARQRAGRRAVQGVRPDREGDGDAAAGGAQAGSGGSGSGGGGGRAYGPGCGCGTGRTGAASASASTSACARGQARGRARCRGWASAQEGQDREELQGLR